MRSTLGRLRWLRVLPLLALQLLAVVLLTEIGIRIVKRVDPEVRRLLVDPAAAAGYAQYRTLEELMNASILGFRPHTRFAGFVLNSRSFRTPEYEYERNRTGLRVVTIGDSFTAASGGIPYSLHWTKLLQDRLTETRGSSVQVINLGVPGVETGFELRLWQIEGSRLDPDIVLLGFCIGNDIPLPEDPTTPSANTTPSELLREQSDLARLIDNLTRLRRAPAHLKEPPDLPRLDTGGYELDDYTYDDRVPSYERADFLEIVARRMRSAHPDFRTRLDAGIDRLMARLTTFRDEVELSGARFVVILIPDEYQLYPDLMIEAAAVAGTDPAEYDTTLPQRELRARFETLQIEYLDLLPVFLQAAAEQSLYRLQDTHWNAAGNRLAAAEIVRHIAPPDA